MPKGNPNPSPKTRFGAGQPQGRKTGSRDRFSAAFLDDLVETWAKHGKKALVHVATKDPSTFVKLGPALLAKEIEIRRPMEGIDDGDLLQAIDALTQALRGPKDEETPKVLQ